MSYLVRSLRGLGRWPALALAAALLTGGTHAPEPVCSIEGTVKDQAGARLAQAQVLIVGTSFGTLTDSAGHYLLAHVPVGRYAVRAVDDVISLAQSAEGEDPEGDRAEFVRLVESARALWPQSDAPVEE